MIIMIFRPAGKVPEKCRKSAGKRERERERETETETETETERQRESARETE